MTTRVTAELLDFRGGNALNPDTNAVSAKLSPFTKRYGPIGAALALHLSIFSHDVIGVIAGYCAYGVAAEGSRPELLFSFPWMTGAYDCVSAQCSPDGDELWLCDGHRVRIFTAQGRFLPYRWISADSSISAPVGVAFSSQNSDAFVISSDATQNTYVHAFRKQSAQLERVNQFGELLHGGFCQLWHIAVDSQERIYVVHRGVRADFSMVYRFSAFTGDGQTIPDLAKHMRATIVKSVTGIAIDAHDRLVVLDGQYAKVFDLKDNICKEFLLSRESDDDWVFTSLAVDRRFNHLVVLDRTHKLVCVFDLANGAHITSFSAPRRPKCLCVDTCGRIFVVCERWVHAYGFRV